MPEIRIVEDSSRSVVLIATGEMFWFSKRLFIVLDMDDSMDVKVQPIASENDDGSFQFFTNRIPAEYLDPQTPVMILRLQALHI